MGQYHRLQPVTAIFRNSLAYMKRWGYNLFRLPDAPVKVVIQSRSLLLLILGILLDLPLSKKKATSGRAQ